MIPIGIYRLVEHDAKSIGVALLARSRSIRMTADLSMLQVKDDGQPAPAVRVCFGNNFFPTELVSPKERSTRKRREIQKRKEKRS